MFAEAKKVRGRTTKLYSIAEAALQRPDDTVGRVVFPAVGEGTLRAPVTEAKTYRARVRTVLTYYRRMPPKLPAAIEFKCNNTAYRPVMDALALFARYAEVPNKVRTCSFLDAAHQDHGPTRSRPESVPADDAALQPRRPAGGARSGVLDGMGQECESGARPAVGEEGRVHAPGGLTRPVRPAPQDLPGCCREKRQPEARSSRVGDRRWYPGRCPGAAIAPGVLASVHSGCDAPGRGCPIVSVRFAPGAPLLTAPHLASSRPIGWVVPVRAA
jgi:hypothetical protein